MRKLLLAFLVGGFLGTGVGVALGFFFFPFVFPPPVAMDALSENERTKVVATGEFLHADPIHYGRGRVTVTPRTVFLEDDFEVGPGDRKSTRLNSSHANISYAVFCLK